MSGRDDFELRVAAGIRGLADCADTSIDPVAVTWRAADAGRRRSWLAAWPRLRWSLVLALMIALLLIALLATTLPLGGRPMPEPPGPTAVEGTMVCGSAVDGTPATLDLATALATDTIRCRLEIPDLPDAGGTIAYMFRNQIGGQPWSIPAPGEPRPVYGWYLLRSGYGEWSGAFNAVPDSAGRLRLVGFATLLRPDAADSFSGWTYAMAVGIDAEPTSDPQCMDVTGVVYPGDLPPDLGLPWSAFTVGALDAFGPEQ